MVQSQKYLKNGAKVPYFNAELGVGSHFVLLRVQKRFGSQISAFWPLSYKWLKFQQNLYSAEVFGQVYTQWGFFLTF